MEGEKWKERSGRREVEGEKWKEGGKRGEKGKWEREGREGRKEREEMVGFTLAISSCNTSSSCS